MALRDAVDNVLGVLHERQSPPPPISKIMPMAKSTARRPAARLAANLACIPHAHQQLGVGDGVGLECEQHDPTAPRAQFGRLPLL